MEGAHVAICDKDEAALEPARNHVQGASPGAKVRAYKVDLTQAQDIDALVARVRQDLGPVQILVTNSGGPPPGAFDAADDEKWEFAYRLTFLSAVRMIRAVLPDMKASRWGRIINFTSRALKEPIPNLMISNAVRLAVGGMAKTLAAEVAARDHREQRASRADDHRSQRSSWSPPARSGRGSRSSKRLDGDDQGDPARTSRPA